MSNQDLINYLISVEATNTAQIATLNQTIGSLKDAINQMNLNIEQYNKQLTDCNTQIDALNQANIDIDLIIAFIPPDSLKSN